MVELNLAYLPDIPIRKILKYYILEKSLNSGIKWTNEHEQINYFPMFCHIWDNLVPNGFVKIDSKITFDLIRKRFPNTKLVEPVNLDQSCKIFRFYHQNETNSFCMKFFIYFI